TSWQPEGQYLSIDEIISRCASSGCSHAVITGGEPMLQREIIPLCQSIHNLAMHITVETAGTVFRPIVCDLMSISPKLANSRPTAERAGRW
ncbi:MAG: 4Fe-4S cluster-binding domain-containing protein, partial [Burkholderiales bacterium]|nr:4Fe-4S cluster-binding domain-containing protein [Burkholderiales bacterium]